MDNVIYVDFSNNPDDSEYEFVIEVDPNTELDHYLDSIRTLGLDEDDVLEVKEAILLLMRLCKLLQTVG